MNMFKKIIIAVGIIVFAAGCSQGEKNDSENVVKIGIITPLSGPATNFGTDAVNSYSYIFEQYKAKYPNKNIELVIEDSKCQGQAAASAVKKLIYIDKVDIILGGSCSTATLIAGEYAQKEGIPMISPTASSPLISNLGDQVFRYRNDSQAALKMIEFLHSRNAKSVLIIHENNDYAQAYADEFATNYDGTIVDRIRYDTSEKDFAIIAGQAYNKLNEIEAIVVVPASDSTALSLMQSFEAKGINKDFDGLIAGANGLTYESILDEVDTDRDNVYTINIAKTSTLGSTAEQFLVEYTESFDINTSEAWILLDAESMSIALDAIIATDGHPSEITRYLHSMDQSNPREGLYGKYHFDQNGDATNIPFEVQKVYDNKLTKVSLE